MYRRSDQPIRRKWTCALRLTRQWLAEHVEDFPIPVEDVIWIERAGAFGGDRWYADPAAHPASRPLARPEKVRHG